MVDRVSKAGEAYGEPGGDADPARILIVDDRPENLLSLEAVLEDVGPHVIRAKSGKEALRAILEQDFAVILLDVQLPGMDGFETASVIRSRERSQHTPIIFLTAVDKSETDVSRGYALGAVDYIFKPFDAHILKAKVKVFIDLYQKSQEIRRLNAELEERVDERTRELQEANRTLKREVAERKRAEEEVRRLNAELEQRVRDRTAELEAANRELKAFSYSVSHDLRAPLRKIGTFSDLLLEECVEELPSVGRQYVARIRAASVRMNELIEDMLRLAQVSSGEMRREQTDLSEIARGIAGDLEREHPERQVRWEIQDGLTAQVDAGLLKLALENLLGNAWKFTAKRPDACIAFGAAEVDGDPAFFVRDNGAGFDMAMADRLFEPFQRLHADQDFSGTGIGLAIVQRVLHRHGGRIWAEAAPDQGATFYFSLP